MSRSTSTNSSSLRSEFLLFALGLLVVYLVAMYVFWPRGGEKPNNALFLVAMFAPTAGALLAKYFGKATLLFGKANTWLIAALIPVAAILVANELALALGLIEVDSKVLLKSLTLVVVSVPAAMISALGEEIGWRGFFWPALRKRHGFLTASTITFLAWWIFHIPAILLGWYGTRSGLPAFTLAIAGVTLVIGVLTDRSNSIWPSVLLHGAWNALVVTDFGYENGNVLHPAFTGNEQMLGEFGWIAAGVTFLTGVLASFLHLRRPMNMITVK